MFAPWPDYVPQVMCLYTVRNLLALTRPVSSSGSGCLPGTWLPAEPT